MKRVYLTGHRTFGNRGCEAIVRSTVALLQQAYGSIEIFVPSDHIELDSKQWPEAAGQGVKFVQAYSPSLARYWAHTQRLPIPLLKQAGWPFPIPRWFKDRIDAVDFVLSVGGDNYSLDYLLPSLLMAMDSFAIKLGKPVVIWGASVGPFDQEPHFIPVIRQHLARIQRIMVRETASYRYLTRTLGLGNVSTMVDPAFMLSPQEVDCTAFWPKDRGHGIIGLNLSPLVERYRSHGQNLIHEVVGFVRCAIQELGYGILLVPHVVPLDGAEKNNDAQYMLRILQQCSDLQQYLKLAPSEFNSSQMKYVIGRLKFFIGARTHATIAALSSQVPTISISYSVKARGINRDLLGNENCVLPISSLSKSSLLDALNFLACQEAVLRKKLSEKASEYNNIMKKAIKQLRTVTHD